METAAIVLARPIEMSPGSWRLLAVETVQFEESEYAHRSGDSIELSPGVIAPHIKRARHAGLSILLAHTHPWDGPVSPSIVDRAGEAKLVPVLQARVRGVPHGRLILGHRYLHAALFVETGDELPLSVNGVGATLTLPCRSDLGSLPEPTFDRQIRALGEAGQETLSQISVSIVGLGGLGSIIAQELAYLGVSAFLLIDNDQVESTNLNRLVGATSDDVGKPKVDVAAEMIKRINSTARIEAVKDDVMKRSVARQVLTTDFFFCCTDSHGSRAVLAQLAYQYLVPGIDSGVRIDSSSDGIVTDVVGRVQMLAPGLACLACTNVLDPEVVRRDLLDEDQRRSDPYIVGAPVLQPAVISLNTTVAGLAVTMFLGAVTDLPVQSRYQIVRFDSGQVRTIESNPDPECSICSPAGFFMRGDSWPRPGRP